MDKLIFSKDGKDIKWGIEIDPNGLSNRILYKGKTIASVKFGHVLMIDDSFSYRESKEDWNPELSEEEIKEKNAFETQRAKELKYKQYLKEDIVNRTKNYYERIEFLFSKEKLEPEDQDEILKLFLVSQLQYLTKDY